MAPIPYVASALCLLGCAWLVFRGLVRHQYRSRASLTWWGTLSQLLVFCGWAYFSASQLPATWPDSDTPPILRMLGWTVFLGGLGGTLAAGVNLGFKASFGIEKPALSASGLYGLVRNPQVAAFGLALIGHTILWPTWRLGGALLLYFPIAHLMVVTEEEHLTRVLGERYRAYRKRVPRYMPGRRRGGAAA